MCKENKEKMTYAPIALFTYNRADHTRRAVESLLQNAEAKDSDLFIFSDGAKNEKAVKGVAENREYIHTVTGFKTITIIEREKNWGLANSLIAGITDVINKYGRVIVVEDDLILSPYFLKFMNDGLEKYKDDDRVSSISGFIPNVEEELPETFFLRFFHCWGWATWDRAWKHFNPNGKELLKQLEERKLTRTFDFNGNYRFTRMLRRQIEGKNNSWAIRWNASLFLADILSLNVGRSLVQNEGFDGSGTNCGGGGLYSSNLWMHQLTVKPISPLTENKEARKAFERYYHRTNCFWAKAIRRIKRTLKGDFGA